MRGNFLVRLLDRLGPAAEVVPELVGREVAFGQPCAGLEATTSRPACASGSAATPPAAPRPMITTSVSLSLIAICHLQLGACSHISDTLLVALEHRVVVGRLVIR